MQSAGHWGCFLSETSVGSTPAHQKCCNFAYPMPFSSYKVALDDVLGTYTNCWIHESLSTTFSKVYFLTSINVRFVMCKSSKSQVK